MTVEGQSFFLCFENPHIRNLKISRVEYSQGGIHMITIKYHLVLTDNEYSLIINSLNNLRNDLIAQGRYTDAVDDVLVEFIGAKKKILKIIYQEG